MSVVVGGEESETESGSGSGPAENTGNASGSAQASAISMGEGSGDESDDNGSAAGDEVGASEGVAAGPSGLPQEGGAPSARIVLPDSARQRRLRDRHTAMQRAAVSTHENVYEFVLQSVSDGIGNLTGAQNDILAATSTARGYNNNLRGLAVRLSELPAANPSLASIIVPAAAAPVAESS